MTRFRSFLEHSETAPEDTFSLSPEESHHLLRVRRAKTQNSLLCGLSGWVESQVEFPTFNERKKTVGFSFEELIRRKWRNLPSKKSPAYNASLG